MSTKDGAGPLALRLRPSVSLHAKSGVGSVSFRMEQNDSRLRVISLSNLDEAVLAVLHRLASGTAVELATQGGLGRFLLDHGLARPDYVSRYTGSLAERTVTFFAEHFADPCAAADRLAEARVAVLGMGGTGSGLVQHLVGAGVRRYILLDGDTVCPTNLNRQYVFTLADAGRPKTDCVAEYIRARIPDAEILCVQKTVTVASDIPIDAMRCDLVACCIDTPAATIHSIVAEAARIHDAAVLFGGVGVHTGTVGPLIHGAVGHAWYAALLGDRASRLPPDVRPATASYGPTNALLGALLGDEAVAYLAGLPHLRVLNTHLHVNFRTLTAWTGAKLVTPDRST